MGARRRVVCGRQHAAGCSSDAKDFEADSGHMLRENLFLLSRRVMENRAPPAGLLDAKQRDVRPGRLAEPSEKGIAEGLAAGIQLGRIGQMDQPIRVAHRQPTEDQRVDERERGCARADGQRQRRDRRSGDDGVPAEDTQAEAEVFEDRLEPGEELDVTALLAQPQRVAKPPQPLLRRPRARVPARSVHPRARCDESAALRRDRRRPSSRERHLSAGTARTSSFSITSRFTRFKGFNWFIGFRFIGFSWFDRFAEPSEPHEHS